MKTAALLFTLLFVTMIALSSTAHLKKFKLTTDATTDAETQQTQTGILLYTSFDGWTTVNTSVPSISLGNQAGDFGTNNFTVAFWFNTASSYNSTSDILGNRQQTGQADFFSVRLTNQNYVLVELCDTSGNGNDYVSAQSVNPGLNDGKFHHLAAVRQGTLLTLYIDGVENNQGSSGNPTNITGVYPLQLGLSHPNFQPLNITFSDLRIYYGTGLSAAQVSAIYDEVFLQ